MLKKSMHKRSALGCILLPKLSEPMMAKLLIPLKKECLANTENRQFDLRPSTVA